MVRPKIHGYRRDLQRNATGRRRQLVEPKRNFQTADCRLRNYRRVENSCCQAVRRTRHLSAVRHSGLYSLQRAQTTRRESRDYSDTDHRDTEKQSLHNR